MSRPRSDRIAGALLLLLAVAYGLEASTFDVGFVADPVGPKALPYLVAGLLALGGLLILARPGREPSWPAAHVWLRIAAVAASFVAYAALLAPLGFVPATTVEVAFLSILFRGRPLRSLAAAAAFSIALWILFVYGLDLRLPAGALLGGAIG